MVGVKICGLTRREDAELAVELGAFAVGFVFEPSSPRYVGSPDWAPDWASKLKAEKVAVCRAAPIESPDPLFSAIQAIDWPKGETASVEMIRIKVLRPRQGDDLGSLVRLAEGFDWVLLDAYNSVKAGGTGEAIDLSLAHDTVCALREACPHCRIGLAGGLTPATVSKSVEAVQPDYVDVASGVESSPGIKDAEKMKAFIRALGVGR